MESSSRLAASHSHHYNSFLFYEQMVCSEIIWQACGETEGSAQRNGRRLGKIERGKSKIESKRQNTVY